MFTTETEQSGRTLHVRDFCPAVGVWESSSAGTTNGALACYLLRHGLIAPDGSGAIDVVAEQGLEIKRASTVQSRLSANETGIARLQVVGVATRLIEGHLELPEKT